MCTITFYFKTSIYTGQKSGNDRISRKQSIFGKNVSDKNCTLKEKIDCCSKLNG